MLLYDIDLVYAVRSDNLPDGILRSAFTEAFVSTVTSPDNLDLYLRWLFEKGIATTHVFERAFMRQLIERGPSVLSDSELIKFAVSTSGMEALAKQLLTSITSGTLADVWWNAFAERGRDLAHTRGLKEAHQTLKRDLVNSVVTNETDPS